MSLVRKILVKDMENISTKVYINTLTPYFEFKNKSGRIIMPIKCSVSL